MNGGALQKITWTLMKSFVSYYVISIILRSYENRLVVFRISFIVLVKSHVNRKTEIEIIFMWIAIFVT